MAIRWWALFLAPLCLRAQVDGVMLLEQRTAAQLKAYAESVDGVMGIAAIDLRTGRLLGFNEDAVFAQASSIKIPILIELHRQARAGLFRFADKVTLNPEESVGGSGALQENLKKGPVTLSIDELATRMIRDSDNTATNKCIGIVGMDRVNAEVERLGFSKIRLQRVMMDAKAAVADRENIATPREMARLVELIYQGRVVDEEASRAMIGRMKLVKGAFRETVPAEVEVASKTGSVTGVHTETGIIFLKDRPFVLSVMANFLADEKNPIGGAVKIAYRHFERVAASNRYGHRVR